MLEMLCVALDKQNMAMLVLKGMEKAMDAQKMNDMVVLNRLPITSVG